MTLKGALVVAGVALIPLWYVYRSTRPKEVHYAKTDFFMDQETKLRLELEATQKELKDQTSPEGRARFLDTEIAECVLAASKGRLVLEDLVKERELWRKDVGGLLERPEAAAIAANEDYVRAFREFSMVPTSESMDRDAKQFEGAEKACNEAKVSRSHESAPWEQTQALEKSASEFRQSLETLSRSRRQVAALVAVASGQGGRTLLTALDSQAILDTIDEIKVKRGKSLYELHFKVPYR